MAARLLKTDVLKVTKFPSNCGLVVLSEFLGGHNNALDDEFKLTDEEWAAVLAKSEYTGNTAIVTVRPDQRDEYGMKGLSIKAFLAFLKRAGAKYKKVTLPYSVETDGYDDEDYIAYIITPSGTLMNMIDEALYPGGAYANGYIPKGLTRYYIDNKFKK